MCVCVLFLLLNLPRPLCAWYIGRSYTCSTTFSPPNCIVLEIYLLIWCLLSLQTIWTRFHPVGFVQCLPPIKCKVKHFACLRPHWVRQNSQSHISSFYLNKQIREEELWGGRLTCGVVQHWEILEVAKEAPICIFFHCTCLTFHHIFLNHEIFSAASHRSHLCTSPDRPKLSLVNSIRKLNTEWLHSHR